MIPKGIISKVACSKFCLLSLSTPLGRQCHNYLSRTCCCVYIAPKVVLGCPRISTWEKCKSTNIEKGKMDSNLSFP
jgi:hypothetical protein